MKMPPLVAVLAYPELCTFEYACAVEVFGLPRPELGAPLYECVTFSVQPGEMQALGGVTLNVKHGLEILHRADTIIIPGWRYHEPAEPELVKALTKAVDRGTRIATICSGAMLLAEAGLLAGKRATTHWRYTDDFQQQYPDIEVEDNVLYVDEGQLLTSAGSAAGLDLCLHMVRSDYGADIANAIARRLVVPPHRDGGQAQYAPMPIPPSDHKQYLAELMEWVRQNLEQPHTISTMAAWLKVSERTLLRRFKEATGETPQGWLVRERLRHSRELLETTNLGMERIAATCGFGSTESFRLHFRRQSGTSPTRYRQQFSTVPTLVD